MITVNYFGFAFLCAAMWLHGWLVGSRHEMRHHLDTLKDHREWFYSRVEDGDDA